MFKTTAKSPTLRMHELANQRTKAGEKIIRFGFGQSPFGPPKSVVEALKENAHEHYYAPVAGIPQLREAVAQFHQQYDKIDCDAGQILINAGSKSLLFAALAAFKTAHVLIPAPTWVSYAPQAELIGHKITPIITNRKDRWRITAPNLDHILSQTSSQEPRVLILTSPGNPDSLIYTKDELIQIAEVARKHDIFIISDEIYSRLQYTGNFESIVKYYPEKTIVTNGLSKWCGAGGWRLGTALIPKNLVDNLGATMIGILSETTSCASVPVQLAALKAYENTPEMETDVAHRRRILQALGFYSADTLNKAGLDVKTPQGGFYIFVDFMNFDQILAKKNITNSAQLCEKILTDTGVALLSGEAFGVPSDYLSARLAFVDFDGSAALNASYEIGLDTPLPDTFIQTHGPNVTEGIQRLSRWFFDLST